MNKAKLIKKTISISLEYECPNTNNKTSTRVVNPILSKGYHFSDWGYDIIEIDCKFCGEKHSYELSI